jgi:hypothetical protein
LPVSYGEAGLRKRPAFLSEEWTREKRPVLERGAQLLLEREKIDGEELKTLMKETSGPLEMHQ